MPALVSSMQGFNDNILQCRSLQSVSVTLMVNTASASNMVLRPIGPEKALHARTSACLGMTGHRSGQHDMAAAIGRGT